MSTRYRIKFDTDNKILFFLISENISKGNHTTLKRENIFKVVLFAKYNMIKLRCTFNRHK